MTNGMHKGDPYKAIPNKELLIKEIPLGIKQGASTRGSLGRNGVAASLPKNQAIVNRHYLIPTEDEFSAYVEQKELDPDAASKFWEDKTQSNWTIRGKPIRDWRKTLEAFERKYDEDRSGR